MIGFYNYTVILTYMGLASSLIGIYLAMSGSHITMAVIALMISGLCDMFDGKVARTRKRTDDEKKFGIQIRSAILFVSDCFPRRSAILSV